MYMLGIMPDVSICQFPVGMLKTEIICLDIQD